MDKLCEYMFYKKLEEKMKLEEGKIFINKKTGQFCKILEITYVNDNKEERTPYQLVCSGDCDFKADAHTYIERKIMGPTSFMLEYEEEKDWNLKDNASFKQYDKCSLKEMSFKGELIEKFKDKVLEDLQKIYPHEINNFEKIINKRIG